MVDFVHGAAAMGSLLVGLFFLRFWRETADRLFLMFALAFWLIAADRTVLGLFATASEWREYVYLLRLGAFCLILYGIVQKNRR